MILSFAFVLLLNFLVLGKEVNLENINILKIILLFIVGVIASSCMVIPGISGSFMLMVLGFYGPIINVLSNLTKDIGYSLMVIIPFGLGCAVGIFLIAKIITKLLEKNKIMTYFAILGFVLSSIVTIVLMIGIKNITVLNVLTSIIMFLWGFFISRALNMKGLY